MYAVCEPKSQATRANVMRGVIEFVESGRVGRSAYASRSRSRDAVPSMRSGVSKVPLSISARIARVRAILRLDFSAAPANALPVGDISTVSIAELAGRVVCEENLGASIKNEGGAFTLPILLTSLISPRPLASGNRRLNTHGSAFQNQAHPSTPRPYLCARCRDTFAYDLALAFVLESPLRTVGRDLISPDRPFHSPSGAASLHW